VPEPGHRCVSSHGGQDSWPDPVEERAFVCVAEAQPPLAHAPAVKRSVRSPQVAIAEDGVDGGEHIMRLSWIGIDPAVSGRRRQGVEARQRAHGEVSAAVNPHVVSRGGLLEREAVEAQRMGEVEPDGRECRRDI